MKPIARTAAQKLRARRAARLAADAETREPNGRLSRRIQAQEARQGETERAVKETVTEARMRVLGLSMADCERPEAGSVLGRLYLDGRNRISKAQFEAGCRMAEDFARYYALTGIPFPAASAIDLTRVHGIGRDPNPAAVRAASNAVIAIEATLGMADESGRPVTSVCKAVCIRDEPIYHGHMIEFLKRGLHALVEHYGVQGD